MRRKKEFFKALRKKKNCSPSDSSSAVSGIILPPPGVRLVNQEAEVKNRQFCRNKIKIKKRNVILASIWSPGKVSASNLFLIHTFVVFLCGLWSRTAHSGSFMFLFYVSVYSVY